MPLAKSGLVCLLLLPDVVLGGGSRHCAPAIAIGATRRASKISASSNSQPIILYVFAREARDLRQRAINLGAFHDERQDRVALLIHRRDRAGRAIIVALACFFNQFQLKLFLHRSFAGRRAFYINGDVLDVILE